MPERHGDKRHDEAVGRIATTTRGHLRLWAMKWADRAPRCEASNLSSQHNLPTDAQWGVTPRRDVNWHRHAPRNTAGPGAPSSTFLHTCTTVTTLYPHVTSCGSLAPCCEAHGEALNLSSESHLPTNVFCRSTPRLPRRLQRLREWPIRSKAQARNRHYAGP